MHPKKKGLFYLVLKSFFAISIRKFKIFEVFQKFMLIFLLSKTRLSVLNLLNSKKGIEC